MPQNMLEVRALSWTLPGAHCSSSYHTLQVLSWYRGELDEPAVIH